MIIMTMVIILGSMTALFLMSCCMIAKRADEKKAEIYSFIGHAPRK